jgi:hypothetical protein
MLHAAGTGWEIQIGDEMPPARDATPTWARVEWRQAWRRLP